MNDEHAHPEPDESRPSPAQTDDDIAALEREARARREAELLAAQDDEAAGERAHGQAARAAGRSTGASRIGRLTSAARPASTMSVNHIQL